MDHNELCQFLHRQRFLCSFPLHVVKSIAEGATCHCVAPGDSIFDEGSQEHRLYLVGRGRVGLDLKVPGHEPVRVLELGPGEILGWSAFLGGYRMAATATAIDEVKVVAFRADRLLALCEADHDLGYAFMRQMALALSRRLIATRVQLLNMVAGPEAAVPEPQTV